MCSVEIEPGNAYVTIREETYDLKLTPSHIQQNKTANSIVRSYPSTNWAEFVVSEELIQEITNIVNVQGFSKNRKAREKEMSGYLKEFMAFLQVEYTKYDASNNEIRRKIDAGYCDDLECLKVDTPPIHLSVEATPSGVSQLSHLLDLGAAGSSSSGHWNNILLPRLSEYALVGDLLRRLGATPSLEAASDLTMSSGPTHHTDISRVGQCATAVSSRNTDVSEIVIDIPESRTEFDNLNVENRESSVFTLRNWSTPKHQRNNNAVERAKGEMMQSSCEDGGSIKDHPGELGSHKASMQTITSGSSSTIKLGKALWLYTVDDLL